MPEVLDIRELGGDEPRRSPVDVPADTEQGSESSGGDAPSAPSRWRRSAAVGIVVVLLMAVAYMLTVARPESGARGRVADAASPAERAARGALDGWAAFASTGDVDRLRDTFDPAGPQFERLNAEAPTVKGQAIPGIPYRFSATVLRSSAGRDQEQQVVVTDVVVTRPGEADQRFVWELVLRRTDNRWLLWTVHDRTTAAPLSSTGGAP